MIILEGAKVRCEGCKALCVVESSEEVKTDDRGNYAICPICGENIYILKSVESLVEK
jgi:hypothetical protein